MKKWLILLWLLAALAALAGCGAGLTGPEMDEILVLDLEEPTTEAPFEAAEPEGSTAEAFVLAMTPQDGELVRAADYIPGLFVELRYSTTDNFTGRQIYDFEEAWLRYATVKKLCAAQEELAKSGFALKIWDAYRPISAQYVLWDVMPDDRFVANPNTGYSFHSNGGTVDLTLVSLDGSAVEMPSDFDDFSSAGDRNYNELSAAVRENAQLLETVMTELGFRPYYGEWWHYEDTEDYPFEDLQSVELPKNRLILYEPDCNEFISFRVAPSYGAEVMEQIPVGERFSVEGWIGDFARIEYRGRQGYVASAYIKQAAED